MVLIEELPSDDEIPEDVPASTKGTKKKGGWESLPADGAHTATTSGIKSPRRIEVISDDDDDTSSDDGAAVDHPPTKSTKKTPSPAPAPARADDDDDDDSDDDMPPPLEDMADSIKLKQRLNATPAKVASKKAVREGTAKPKPPPAPVKGPEDGIWVKRAVILERLSAKQYNGQTGVCTSWDQEKGRYGVKLDKGGKSLKIKVANLKLHNTAGGFGKGFLAGGGGGGGGGGAAAADDDIEMIKPKDPSKVTGRFDEVQDEMKKAGGFLEENSDEWCTPDLLQKLATKPQLMKMLENPNAMRAIAEFQKDPKAAAKKYEGTPEVMQFFKDFCEIMGTHLNGLADKQDSAKGSGGGGGANGGGGGAQQQSSGALPPALETAEDRRMRELMQRPDVQDALQDPRIQTLIDQLRKNPRTGDILLRQARSDPVVMRKLQVLISTGILGTSMQ